MSFLAPDLDRTTAGRVVRRYLAARRRFYRYDRRRLKMLNDPSGREDLMRLDGGYAKYRIEIVPLKDVKVPKVWNQGRFDQAKALIEQGKPLDPIKAHKEGSKWVINDGIHRTNASIALEYTHVPVLVSEWIETPEAYEPEEPEKPQLAVGTWVKLRQKSFAGLWYGWVSEQLGQRFRRGVQRWRYGLDLVGPDSSQSSQADYSDHEFDPVRPPSWARKVREHTLAEN